VVIGSASLIIFVSTYVSALATSEIAGGADLEVARSAAKAFCVKYKFPPAKMRELDGSPVLGPSALKYEGQNVTAYRWLGGGRGDYYVQVMFYHESNRVVVHGGYEHKEFGPCTYKRVKNHRLRCVSKAA
jgi:hypothetical protein